MMASRTDKPGDVQPQSSTQHMAQARITAQHSTAQHMQEAGAHGGGDTGGLLLSSSHLKSEMETNPHTLFWQTHSSPVSTAGLASSKWLLSLKTQARHDGAHLPSQLLQRRQRILSPRPAWAT